MSFGIGIGDILTVITLTKDTYTAIKDAPSDFQGLKDEVKSLQACLTTLLESQQQILENATQAQKARLFELLESCCDGLLRFVQPIQNYRKTGERNLKGMWDTLRLALQVNKQDARDRIAVHTASVTIFLTSMTQCSLQRLEWAVRNSVYSVGVRNGVGVVGGGGRTAAGAQVLDGQQRDMMDVWSVLGQQLATDGITAADMLKFRYEIIAYVKHLKDGGEIFQRDNRAIQGDDGTMAQCVERIRQKLNGEYYQAKKDAKKDPRFWQRPEGRPVVGRHDEERMMMRIQEVEPERLRYLEQMVEPRIYKIMSKESRKGGTSAQRALAEKESELAAVQAVFCGAFADNDEGQYNSSDEDLIVVDDGMSESESSRWSEDEDDDRMRRTADRESRKREKEDIERQEEEKLLAEVRVKMRKYNDLLERLRAEDRDGKDWADEILKTKRRIDELQKQRRDLEESDKKRRVRDDLARRRQAEELEKKRQIKEELQRKRQAEKEYEGKQQAEHRAKRGAKLQVPGEAPSTSTSTPASPRVSSSGSPGDVSPLSEASTSRGRQGKDEIIKKRRYHKAQIEAGVNVAYHQDKLNELAYVEF